MYWRDHRSSKEVVIIVKSPGYHIPFEIKYRESPDLSNKSGLVAHCRLEKIKRAYCVTKHDRNFGATTFKDVTHRNGDLTRFLKILAHILC